MAAQGKYLSTFVCLEGRRCRGQWDQATEVTVCLEAPSLRAESDIQQNFLQ